MRGCGAPDPRFRFISLRRGWECEWPDRQTRPRCWFVPYGSTFVSAFGMAFALRLFTFLNLICNGPAVFYSFWEFTLGSGLP